MSARTTMLKKAWNTGNKFTTVAMPAYFAASEYNRSRESGQSVVRSVANAGFDYALGEALGFKGMLALGAAQTLPTLAVNVYQASDRMSRELNSQNVNTPFMNSNFGDTQQAYTMRQHGMQLAKNSRYNLEQSLMGNEASHFKY